MSLLMDALKKAELAKRQAGKDKATAPHAPAGLELSPLDAVSSSTTHEDAEALPFSNEPAIEPAPGAHEPASAGTLPELPQSLELLDQEFIAGAAELNQRMPDPPRELPQPVEAAAPAPAPLSAPPATAMRAGLPPPEATQAERAAAHNLFEAKQPPKARRATLIALGMFGLMGVLAIGIYFWLQLQPKSSLAGRSLASAPATAGQVRPAPLPAPVLAETAAADSSTSPAVEPKPDTAETEPPKPSVVPTREAPTAAFSPQPNLFRVSKAVARLDVSVDKGYQALQRGDLAAAQAAYMQALKDDPRNADALHGLASVQLRQGHPDQAEELYLRAIENDPKDALAQASLISLNSRTDPVQSESRLKLLLSSQPESAFLHFYLGNLYARQSRWPEAQESYFRAMSGDPANADYLFNLAVSLDQLHQARPAAQYYAKALQAAQSRPAGFDKQQVAERLAQLQQQ